MKKLMFCLFVAILTFTISCSKERNTGLSKESPFSDYDLKKDGWISVNVSVSFKAGHDAGELCQIPFVGDLYDPSTYSWFHMPCWGEGENCTWTIGIQIGSTGNPPVSYDTIYPVIATFPYGICDSILLMPARSFFISDSASATAINVSALDDGDWINVPAQTLNRIDSIHYAFSYGAKISQSPDFQD